MMKLTKSPYRKSENVLPEAKILFVVNCGMWNVVSKIQNQLKKKQTKNINQHIILLLEKCKSSESFQMMTMHLVLSLAKTKRFGMNETQ